MALHFVLRWIEAGGGAAAVGLFEVLAFALAALLLAVPAMSWRAGLAWCAGLGIILFILGLYQGWQIPKTPDGVFPGPFALLLPFGQVMFYLTFIASALVLAAARDRRL